MQLHQASPTGRRKITEKMLAARAARPSSFDPVERGLAMSAAKRAFPALGVPSRVRELVDLLAGCTKLPEWLAGRPMCWPQTSWLCEAMGLGRTQVKTLIRLAQEWGLIEMRDAPNGQRWGRRDNGELEAYGFDLSPLLARRAEFEAIAKASAERRREGARLRRQIGAVRNQVLSLVDLAMMTAAGGDWQHVGLVARQLGDARGNSFDPAELHRILAQLHELHTDAEEVLTPQRPVHEAVETDPMGTADRPPITPTNSSKFAKAKTKADGPSRPEVNLDRTRERESSRSSRSDADSHVAVTDKREGRRPSALRGFLVTPEFILHAVPALAAFTNSKSPGWPELLDAAFVLRSQLGISQHAWGQACMVLGRTEAIATLAVVAVRFEAGEVQNPGGMLRRMVELHERGALHLDRSLFGLADNLDKLKPGRRQPSGPRMSPRSMQ